MTIETNRGLQEGQKRPLSGMQLVQENAREHGALVITRSELLRARVALEDHSTPQRAEEARRLLSAVPNLPIKDRVGVMNGLSEIYVDYQGNVTRRIIEPNAKK